MIIKKNKLVFGVILFFFSYLGIAQINNHWQLGGSDFDFSTDPVMVNTIAGVSSSNYGLATISDNNGDLLFYTNGNKVWNKNHQLMGEISSVDFPLSRQKVVIVPHPGNSNQYYIFFSIADASSSIQGNLMANYNYAIVDFSTNNLGELMPINNQNVGLNINAGSEYSELLIVEDLSIKPQLTTVYNENNNFYWIIARIRDKMYSFKVDSQGLDLNPVISSISELTYKGTSYPGSDNMHRFSPDNSKLVGLCYLFDNSTTGPYNPTGNHTSVYSLDFDISTGLFSNYQNISVSTGSFTVFTDFEFSNNSNNIYLVRRYKSIYEQDPSIERGEIFVKNLDNLSLPLRKLSLNTDSSVYSKYFSYVQRDRHGNLLARKGSNIGIIINQNSYSNSSVMDNYVQGGGSYFPQLIPESSSCLNDIVINNDVLSGNSHIQSASNTIIATNVINANATAEYDSGTSVTLKPGFHAKQGSDFLAYIEGCSSSEDRGGNIIIPRKNTSLSESETAREVSIYPNPVISEFTFESDFKMKNWYLMDINGNVKLKGSLMENKLKSPLINMDHFTIGNYFLKVIFEDQNALTKSIIKK